MERAALRATKGRPEGSSVKSLWSALQTHLQGVDRATLAIMPEKSRHRAALLSRLREVKITRPARQSKPTAKASAKSNRESRRGLNQQKMPAIDSRRRRARS